jgi:hypothetical protein
MRNVLLPTRNVPFAHHVEGREVNHVHDRHDGTDRIAGGPVVIRAVLSQLGR